MTRALCLMLALAQAEPALTPSSDFELERDVEQQRARVFALRLSAGVGFGLAATCAAWVLAELIALERSKAAGPLAGPRYVVLVPPLALLVAAVVLAGGSIGMEVGAAALARHADDDEEALERLRR